MADSVTNANVNKSLTGWVVPEPRPPDKRPFQEGRADVTPPNESFFTEDKRLHDGGFFGVWRARVAAGGHDVVGIRIVGPLTDERNPVWRAWLDERFAVDGWPRFIALNVKDALPAASLPRRLQTAMWGKKVLGLIERATIHLGSEASVSLTVRATLRIAGMNNVDLRDTDAAFADDVRHMLGAR
jgi:hypothetical protein